MGNILTIVVLFVALVAFYVLYHFMSVRARRQMEAERLRLEREHRKALEEMKRLVLSGVSQELLTPITLIISPLQQMAAESLTDDMRARVQMVLRNAQMLLHQVNMLPVGIKSDMVPISVPTLDSVPASVADENAGSIVGGEASLGIDDSNAAQVSLQRDAATKGNARNGNNRFTLLMVDDSPDMCRFVRDYFRGEYNVLTAGDGEQALECLQDNDDIDLVVSDVAMPKMDGLELCKHIKTDLRWSHIPVILLTGRHGEQLEVEGLRLGADDYITKPFNVQMLRLRIKKFIEKRNNRQRQFRENDDVAASEITITSVDEQFLQQAIRICEDHMDDTEFSVEALGRELSLSRTYLYKKLVNITGKGPAEFIRTIRMKRGKQYLEQSSWPIADIAAKLGYASPKRFTENFKAEYGMSPSEYVRKYRGSKIEQAQS